MPEAARHSPVPDRSVVLRGLIAFLIPFALGLAVGISCAVAGGVSLGIFFGPMLLLPFLAPLLVMSEQDVPVMAHPFRADGTLARRLIVCIALTLGILSVWAVTANLSLFDLTRCGMVLAGLILALAGGAAMLNRLGIPPVFSAAAASLAGIAWLTWPVWLSPWLDGPKWQAAIPWLTNGHPLMALNGILYLRFNFWDRFNLAYQQLTTLNQDVLYSLPRSIALMVSLHWAFGVSGLLFATIRFRRRT